MTHKWLLKEFPNGYHVVPEWELHEHIPNVACPCKPVRDKEAPAVIIHNELKNK
jgi:hypothetical protein